MKTTETFPAIKNTDGRQDRVEDVLTVEEMLSISINQKAYTITMRTPGDEEAHTRGILLTEDVYNNHEVNPSFSILEKNEQGIITKVNVSIPEAELQAGIEQKRNLLSVSSCGMCGKYEMDLRLHGQIHSTQKLKAKLVASMFANMKEQQTQFALSGGCHAAALFTVNGLLLDCKEDIGRHNAVDKTIGSLLLQHRLHEAQILLVSGRVSYEIVNKAHKASIPFLCSVSAPSGMAVEYCQQVGITLLAFCRDGKFTVYSHEENLEF